MPAPSQATTRNLGLGDLEQQYYTAMLTGLNPDGTAQSLPVASNPQWPTVAGSVGGVAVTASATGANSAATATLPAAAGKTTWITGFTCTASGATAGLATVVTVTGVVTGTMSFVFTYPAGVLVGATPLVVAFPVPVPSSAVNTAVSVVLPAGGNGNTNSAVTATGFQL